MLIWDLGTSPLLQYSNWEKHVGTTAFNNFSCMDDNSCEIEYVETWL